MNIKPEYIDIHDIMEFLGLSESYIRKLVREKKIPHIRPGGGRRVKFDLKDVQGWMESQKIKVRGEAS